MSPPATFASTAPTASSCANPVAPPTCPIAGFAASPCTESAGDDDNGDAWGDPEAFDGQPTEGVPGLIAKLNLPRGLPWSWPYLSPVIKKGVVTDKRRREVGFQARESK